MTGRYDGLAPADRLEAQRRDEADRRAAESGKMDSLLRADYRRAKGLPIRKLGRPAGPALQKDRILTSYRELAKLKKRPTQEKLAERLNVPVRTLQDALTAHGIPWPPE